jgi:IS605 OrfB family transposase
MSKAREENKLLTYRYRAYLTDLQQYRAENWLYILCNFYNQALEERKIYYKDNKKTLSYTEQQNKLPLLKKTNPELRLIHSQVLQDCLRRVDKAYQKFFDDLRRKKNGEKIKVGYPKRKKLSRYNSFTFPQVWMNSKKQQVQVVKINPVNHKFACITLPGFGKVKIRYHRALDVTKAKTVTLKRERSDKWFICITVEKDTTTILPDNGNLHKLALWLVLNYSLIFLEKLNIKGMVKNHNLAKAIHDAGWGKLVQYVTYKSVMLRGILPVFVNPNGTSKLCSKCGSYVDKTLADRVHVCPNCGLEIDRDVNAALNILKVGLEQSEPNACGDTDLCLSNSGKPVSLKQEAPSVREE